MYHLRILGICDSVCLSAVYALFLHYQIHCAVFLNVCARYNLYHATTKWVWYTVILQESIIVICGGDYMIRYIIVPDFLFRCCSNTAPFSVTHQGISLLELYITYSAALLTEWLENFYTILTNS
jgi:hypothetical protein